MKGRSSNAKHESGTPLQAALKAIRAEVEAAAMRLGFDVRDESWPKLLTEEGQNYPCPFEGSDHLCKELTPKKDRARVEAIEAIEHFIFLLSDNADEFRQCDEALTKLRDAMAVDPTRISLEQYVERREEREVA